MRGECVDVCWESEGRRGDYKDGHVTMRRELGVELKG